MLDERALDREHADLHVVVASSGTLDHRVASRSPKSRPSSEAIGLRIRYQPRTARRSASGIVSRAMPRIGAPRPLLTSAMIFGLSKWVVAWTIALAIRRRVLALEDARADEDALGAELHHQRRVGRGGDPAGDEVHDRQLALGRDPADELERRLELLGGDEQLVLAHRPGAGGSRR